MSVSKSALAALEDPVALGAIQSSNGSFADTPERRAYENAREEAAVNSVNAAAGFKNALTRALQSDAESVIDALDAQKMIEPSSRVRSGLRAARTMAYARDILKNPDRYQDGDASAALDALSDGFSHDVSEWKRVKGMTDDPRQNLSTYVNMLDGLSIPANLAAAEPSSPYSAYYEATRSQETRDWDAIASAPLDVRFSHAIGKDPGGKRFTDVAKDWVHANLFDEEKITPEEEAAWVASEGGYDADAMRRYFANRGVRGKGAKEIVRDRERQLALEGAAGVLVHSKPNDGRIPDQDYLVNPRQGKDGKLEYDRIEKLTDLTLDEYAETEKRRDDFVMKRRVVDAFQKRMDKKVAEDRAHAMLPFLNEYEAAAALSALRGEDMAKYRSFFENGFGNDTERRDMVWSVCASLRPRDAHGAWEDLIGRFGEGVDKAAFLSGKAASSLWNSYTRWPEILGTLAASGQEAAIAEKKASDEELKDFSKDLRFQLQYRQTMEAWIPNADDNFAEQAVKGLADSGFLQGAAITASLAHIGGSALMRSPHPASKIGGAVLHGVGYLTDAFGAASMVGDSFENMMMNGVDAERAATVGLYAGCLNYLIEKGDVDMFLGKGLSPAELRKTGFRALFKAISKKDPRLVMEALKADAKNSGRVAIAECAEEFGQALVDSGALKFAKGGEFSAVAFASAYLNQDTLKDGIDGFIDAIPTCMGFGLMANHSPLRGKNAQAIDAYAQLADETAKRYALKHHIDTANAEDMAKVRRLVLENAARHSSTAANMDYEQRRAYFGQAAQEAGMSPSEAAFYEQAADLYRTLSSFEGQQYADAAMHGEINEAVLARAGIAVGHDENGYINAVTVDGHTRTVVTERGTRVETDAHTGETGNVRGYYDPKDDSIHITVPETVSDVGETARTTTAPHELLHAALEAMSNDPALTEEQRQTLDALLKTETPSPNGTKLDANEAAAQFVERVFAVANRNFTPDREVVAIGNVVRNIGIALKKVLGSKSEYLPAIIRKAGKGGISITDLLDPSFLADLDALQIAAEDKGTADPVVAWYANTMQPFFKALVDARSRTETAANLDAAEAQTAAERGDTRGNSAVAGITFEETTSSPGDVEPVADQNETAQTTQTINLPNGYSAEVEIAEIPISNLALPGDPDYDANLANLYALHEAESDDGVPVVAGGGNVVSGVNSVKQSKTEGKKRVKVRRIRKIKKSRHKPGNPNPFQEAKRTGVRRFLETHGNAYPALRYWLEHGRHIIDGSDPYIKAYLDNLSPADRMFLTGFGKGGTTADHLVEDFLNQYRSANETANERHYDGTMKPEDVLDQALRERDAYRQWKADGALSPDEQNARDEHDKFIADGHTEDEWNQHLKDLGNPLLEEEVSGEDDAAIDAQIAEDVAAGFFSLVREYDDIIGDQLASITDAPRFSLSGRTSEEQEVWDRYHDADGTPLRGWMTAPNGKPTRLTERQWLQVRTPAFKKWFGDCERAYYMRGWYDVVDSNSIEVYKQGAAQTDILDRNAAPVSTGGTKRPHVDYKISNFIYRVNGASVSKVVDENGEPLVVYHGSTWDPLSENSGKAVFRTGQLETGAGAHFGTRKAADERSEGNRNWKVGGYYLSICNPLEVSDTGYWTPGDIVSEVRKTISDFPWLDDWNAIKSELKKRGYDGFRYKNAVEDEGSTSYVAFYPDQIKSATDNTGAFSRTDADIRYSVARMNEAARRKDLLAVHNLHVEGIRKIAEMGGFAMPSIAVVRDDYGHREFGDCTVLFDKSTIDPKKNRQNALYSHDAWTPSFPKLEPHIDMKAAYAFTKTIRELVDKANVGDVVRSWYSFDDEDGVARMLDHADSLAAAYAYETAAKAAYLVSHGRPVERVMTPADFSQKMPYKLYFLNNDQIVALGEKFGGRIFDSDGYLTGDFDDKLAKDIHDWSQPYRKDGKSVKDLDNGDVYKIGQTLLDIRRNGMGEQFDRYETENRIQKAVASDDPGLVKWLEGLTKDIVTEYGVWNGKEIFDARGNRRSWKTLHEVPTLENIVKSMKKTQLENGSGVLGRNTFGVAVKKFRTTDDMIANENLLKPLTHEEEKAIKDALSDRLSALVIEYMQTNEHPYDNQFIEHDRALDMMFDAWEQGRGNFASMKKLLNGWGYSADDDLVQRIKGVFDDMSVMVTNYFEAKPQRAVRFDEMKAWIVPDTITSEDRRILEDNGQRIYTYRAGDETDRLRAVNRAADATGTRFSLHVNPNLRADVEAALVKRVSSDDQSHQMKRHDEVVFSEDFPFFEFLGLPNVRVVSDVVKIRKFAIKHHLTEDQIADLPNRYNNPVAVMKDGEGGFVALTDMKAQTDNGDEKPVRVYLRPREWRNGEVVFVATAMAENAADERKYYEPIAKSGLLYADENRIAGLGLEEETESILRTQASGDSVLTSSDYSLWSTRNSIAYPGADVNGVARHTVRVNPNLRSDVEAMVSGRRRDGSKVIRHERVVFSSMPDLLVRLGLPDVNIESDRARVQKIVGKHGLTYDQIADIPNRCSAPVAVFKDGESAYVILTDMTAKALDGMTKPVMVRLTEKVGVNGESVFVASAYSRDSDKESEYVRLVNTPGCALYFDENKVAALGLEEGTKSTLCTLTGRDDVMTSEDYSSSVTADSISNPGADVNVDYEPRYSIRAKEPPKRTGIGYKAFYRAKDGKLYPPMVANPNGADTPVGVWLDADEGVRAEDSKTGRKKVKAGGKGTKGGSGSLAWRPGWHLGKIPYALQFNVGEKVPNPLGITNKKGEVIEVGRYFPANLVWGEVEYAADVDYQEKAHEYGVNENGNYEHAKAGLPYLPTDGSYEYRTNPNPATDPWIITGAMKVNRILKRDEVDELVRKAGREPQRVEPRYSLRYLGGADLTVEDNARYFKTYITSINPAAEPERIADGSPKSTLEWFLANMVGKTYSFDIPGIGKRVFTPKAGHIGKLVCSGKGKGIISKPYEGQWIDAVMRGDISGSDVNGWDYDRAKSLPLIDDMLTSFDALIYDESRDAPSVVFLKRYVRKDGKTNTIVMRVVSDGETIGPVSAHVKDVTLAWLMDKKRLVVNEDGQLYGMGKDNSASDAHLPSADAENQSAGSGNSIAYPGADVNAPRFSLSLGIEGEADPFSAKNNPVDFLLAHRIFANGGKVPSRKETDSLLKRFGSKEQPRDVIARAVSLSQNIAGFLDRIGQNPDVVRAVAAAGLAVEAKGAQTRAQNALMTFDAKAAEAKGKIDAAYRRQVENASGIGYREMLSYYGLDMEQILLAMPPPSQNRAKAAQDAAGDAPTPDAYELTDADRAAVDAAVAAIVSRGEGLAAAANAEHPGQPEKATAHETTETVDEAEADPEFLRAQAMNAAVVEAVRKSGITIDNPLAMVALVRRLTEDYIRRNPDAVPDFNEADPFASRVALAVFAANISQFAQAVAQGYAPSYARVRIARLCERLDGRGLSTLRQVERVGEMIFADLSRDVIRQSRADLMRNLHNGDAPKKGEAKDPNRWRGIDYYAKKHGVNLAEPDRVVSAFAGNYLRILKRVVELSKAKAAERAAKLQETVDAFKDTDDKAKYRDYQNALLELDILSAYGALRTKMPAEIADKSAAIKSFVMLDLDALNAKKEAFEQKRVTLRDAMTAAIAGNPKDNGRMPDKHPGFLYSLVGMLDARSSVLTSFCKDPAKRQAALDAFAYVQRLLFHGYTQERAFLNDAKAAMRDAVKSVFGRFGQNTFAKFLDTKLDEATCKLLDRGGQKTKWRIGNVMQMYVSCLQADYAENCKTHGRDGDYVNVLKSVIEKADPRLLRMIDVMRGMYAGYGREISRATLSASGVPIQTPNPLYMPVKPLLLMRAKNGEGRAFHPYAPALTPRVKHGYDFDQSADIMELWQDRIQQSAHTIGFLEAAPLIQGTMQSSHVLEAIHAAWGEKYANHWNDYVLTCLAGRKATSMPKVMADLSRSASRLFLWFNVGSNINQLQAVFTSALSRDVGGMRGMAKNLSFWALKPVDMWQAARDLTETKAFKARYGSDLNAAIAAAQREGKYGVLRSTVGTVADVGMKGIEIGDKVGVLALANVYRSERIALENAGMDQAEASEQAAEKLMLIAENTAQGTTDMNTFDEQSRLGSLTSLFMQFKTAPLQQFGYEFAAFQDWKAAPTDPKRAMRLLSVIIVNHVLASIVPTAIDALMTAVFGALRGDDDGEKEKNRRRVVARALARAFLGPFGSVMFYGVIADNAVQFVANWMTEGKLVRKPFGSSGSLPADNAVEMISNAVEGGASTLFNAVEKGTIDDLWKTSIDVIAELATMTYPGRIYKKSKPKKK